ncbi:DUF3114 domain-containing protein [Streptococcus phocae subsp. phocae]
MRQKMIARYQALRAYQRLGLSAEAFQALAKVQVIDYRLGSPSFWFIWQLEKTLKPAKELLDMLLCMVDMPHELSGHLEETQTLVARFHPDLSPDHIFWKEVAQLVDHAFPEQSLDQEGELERCLHQFRYLVSSQQAQYIRHHFKSSGMTDRQALALFLKGKKGPAFWRRHPDYTLMDSARLHNKVAVQSGQIRFPDQEISYNIKVLIDFHTEFILDSQGRFLNEIDAEVVSQKGLINGASFNYGTRGKRHWDLDVAPIRRHDPAVRKKALKGYQAPRWIRRNQADFEWSYFNKRGLFSRDRKSCFDLVKAQAKQFKAQIKNS